MTKLQLRIMQLETKEKKLKIVWDIITNMTDTNLMGAVLAAWEEKELPGDEEYDVDV